MGDMCPLCGSITECTYQNYPGYRLNMTYNIRYCGFCETSYADPIEADESIYNSIYRYSRLMPGYNRYHIYAKEAKRRTDPIKYLTNREDVYYAAFDSIVSRLGDDLRGGGRIIEIGSGLGYFTYSLYKRGYDIRGIDISGQSVSDAIGLYGKLFSYEDLYDYQKNNKGIYDVVVALEVIEHIPDPIRFLRAAKELLRENGVIVLTTPNKTVYPKAVAWCTDAPPVHLLWLSEGSLRYMAAAIDMNVSFYDMSKCPNKKHAYFYEEGETIRMYEPVLNLKNRPTKMAYRILVYLCLSGLEKLGLSEFGRKVRNRMGGKKKLGESANMCCVLSRM